MGESKQLEQCYLIYATLYRFLLGGTIRKTRQAGKTFCDKFFFFALSYPKATTLCYPKATNFYVSRLRS